MLVLWEGASDNNQVACYDSLASLHAKCKKNINGPAYQKQSSDSVLFLKTYAVFQEKVLNGKSLTFQKLTKKYINFLAGDINLVKVSL